MTSFQERLAPERKAEYLKIKNFWEPDCRCKNGIDEFVILVQCFGYFLRESWRWQLFTASRGFDHESFFFFIFSLFDPASFIPRMNSLNSKTRLIDTYRLWIFIRRGNRTSNRLNKFFAKPCEEENFQFLLKNRFWENKFNRVSSNWILERNFKIIVLKIIVSNSVNHDIFDDRCILIRISYLWSIMLIQEANIFGNIYINASIFQLKICFNCLEQHLKLNVKQ